MYTAHMNKETSGIILMIGLVWASPLPVKKYFKGPIKRSRTSLRGGLWQVQ